MQSSITEQILNSCKKKDQIETTKPGGQYLTDFISLIYSSIANAIQQPTVIDHFFFRFAKTSAMLTEEHSAISDTKTGKGSSVSPVKLIQPF